MPMRHGTFTVEVSIPESYPATVSPFATEATLRRGSPSTSAGCNPKMSRAAGFAGPVAAEPTVVAIRDTSALERSTPV